MTWQRGLMAFGVFMVPVLIIVLIDWVGDWRQYKAQRRAAEQARDRAEREAGWPWS